MTFPTTDSTENDPKLCETVLTTVMYIFFHNSAFVVHQATSVLLFVIVLLVYNGNSI